MGKTNYDELDLSDGLEVDGVQVIDGDGDFVGEVKFADGEGIVDSNDNELLEFGVTASAVNHVKITNAATGNAVDIAAVGDDTNIDLQLTPKGSGAVAINSTNGLDVNPGSDTDVDVITIGVTGTPKLSWVEADDEFNLNKPLQISTSYVPSNSELTLTVGLESQPDLVAAGNITGSNYYGAEGALQWTENFNLTSGVAGGSSGLLGRFSLQSTGTVDLVNGTTSLIELSDTGTIDEAYGHYSLAVATAAGTITEFAMYGGFINNVGGATITDAYGLRLTDITAGSNNYAIYTGAGENFLGDQLTVDSDTFIITTSKTPSSASDTGTQGHIAWDADYIYVCTATDTWKRVAIATW